MRKRVASFLAAAALGACHGATGPEPSRAAAVQVSPRAATISTGDTLRLVAVVTDEHGIPVRSAAVTWGSSDPTVAFIDASGLVTGTGEGSVTLSASVDTVRGNAALEVWRPVSVTRVSIDSTVGPLLRKLSVALDGPAGIEVDYWSDDSPRLRIRRESIRTEHDALLPRLRAGAFYQFAVRTLGPTDLRGPAELGAFRSDTLPSGLAAIHLEVVGRSSSGLAMLEVLRSPVFTGYVIVDDGAHVVWYWPAPEPAGATRRSNGDFVFREGPNVSGEGTSRLRVVSPERRVTAELSAVPGGPDVLHHDVIATPQNTLLFLTRDAERTVNDTVWIGDRIWEWDPDRDIVELRWDVFDTYSVVEDRGPRSRPDDWGHANALSLSPRGNVLVSLHFLNQIVSLTPDFAAVEWKLGGRGSDFVLEPDAVFTGQHTVAEVASGRVLMFDNQHERASLPPEQRWSRALELELEPTEGTAVVAWEFRAYLDKFSAIISSARRLGNGNTLVTFGAPSVGSRKEVYEVSSRGQVLWYLQVDNVTMVYRANPVHDIAGEFLVEHP